ncbi:MAG: transporter substrate-binding domain-containing protein [Spirochaetota bacterium]
MSVVTCAAARPGWHGRGHHVCGAPGLAVSLLGLWLVLIPVAGVVSQAPAGSTRITIAAEPDYPPYSFIDATGAPTGFSVELFEAVAGTMGLEVTVETDYWSAIKEDLAAGRIDALPLVGRTPERELVFDFTVPYLSLYGGIVVRDDETRFSRLDDLAGRRVAVMAGDNAEEFLLRSETNYEIRRFPTFVDALVDLEAGGSDAVVMQRLVALRILREEGLDTLRLLEEPVREFRQDFCFAVTEGDKELLAILNEGLSLAVADGTFRRLQTEWFAAMELPTRTIVVGVDEAYPPFEFVGRDGSPTGFNVDLARAIADEMELDVEIAAGSWSDIVGRLERGEIDVIAGMMYSPQRDRFFDFSPAHTVHQHVAIGRRGDERGVASSVEELAGATIAVQEGDIMHDFVVEHDLDDDLVVVDSQEDALRLVLSGEIDYALGSRLTAMYLIEENGWGELVPSRTSLVSPEYGFAVREGNVRLLSYFAEGLAVVEESGEYRRIYDEWLGDFVPAAGGWWRVGRTVLLILAPIIVVLVTVVVWNRTLRAQVARTTSELQRSAQRTQWLNSVATSYLTRKDAQSLIRETVETLDPHFPNVRAEFLTRNGGEGSIPSHVVDSLCSKRLTILRGSADDGLEPGIARALAREGVRALAAVEVVVEGAPVGCLAFLTPAPREWSDHEIRTLEGHANLLTLILENETYQRRIEETNSTLAASLAEKEILLKEVHHRVKNNLNVIVSLLRLQEDQIDSVEDAHDAFEKSCNRIFSMALVHQTLYQSDSLADIELDQYIRTLVDQLSAARPGNAEIRFDCDLEPARIDVGTAVPCGIIINELVTNAHKHAFPDAAEGRISISLTHDGERSLRLAVRDDGVGIPEAVREGAPATLGLKLVTLLVAQIDGSMTVSGERGTSVEIVFPVGPDESATGSAETPSGG